VRVCRKCRGQQPGGRLAQLADTAAELERDAARWRHSSLARPEHRRACAVLWVRPVHAERSLHKENTCIFSTLRPYVHSCGPQRLRKELQLGPILGAYLGAISTSLLAARVGRMLP